MNTQYLLNAPSPDALASAPVAAASAPTPSTYGMVDYTPADHNLPSTYKTAMGPTLSGGKGKGKGRKI